MGRNRSALRKPSTLVPNVSSSTSTRVPSGNTFVHVTSLPSQRRDRGVPAVLAQPSGLLHAPSGKLAQTNSTEQTFVPSNLHASNDAMSDEEDEYELFEEDSAVTGDEYAKQQDKKRRQWRKWSETIIPEMLKPYLSLLRETESFRSLDNVRRRQICTGCSEGRVLQVSCIYFNSMYFHTVSLLICCLYILEIDKISVCTCKQAALVLLSLGLFPCAPTYPTLAVDLNLLDFVQQLFVNSSPNVTAWCETLEGFLSARKFKLTTRVCFILLENTILF